MRILIGTFLFISAQLWIIATPCHGQERIFLFSQDAKYIEINPENLSITDVGNLWHLKIPEIDDTINNMMTNDILVNTKIWRLLDVQNPSRELWEARGLAVLQRPEKGGGLLLRAYIRPPMEDFSLLGGKTLKRDDTLLYLTWVRDTSTSQEFIVAAYDRQYRLVRTFPGQFILPRSCVSPRTGLIYTPQMGPWSVLTLDPSSGAGGSFSYGDVGAATYFSKTVMASEGCKALIIERKSSHENPEDPCYLYDFDAKKLISTFRCGLRGVFYLVDDRHLILVDEHRIVTGAGGANEILRLGRLHVLKFSGEEIGVVELPPGGHVAAIAGGGTRVIYSAPGSVSLVDLLALKARTLTIPFLSFKVGAWNAKQ